MSAYRQTLGQRRYNFDSLKSRPVSGLTSKSAAGRAGEVKFLRSICPRLNGDQK
jgi:hypothetical protein